MSIPQQLLKIRVASNGKQALALCLLGGKPVLYKYAPKSFGTIKHDPEFNRLFLRAAAKLGFKRDRRCKGGFRYVEAIANA